MPLLKTCLTMLTSLHNSDGLPLTLVSAVDSYIPPFLALGQVL